MHCCRNYSAVFPTPPYVPLCWATNSHSHAASLLFLFFFSLAVDPVQFLVLPLSDNVTLFCAPVIYTVYLPVHGSEDPPLSYFSKLVDSPGSNLAIQDRFRKKV